MKVENLDRRLSRHAPIAGSGDGRYLGWQRRRGTMNARVPPAPSRASPVRVWARSRYPFAARASDMRLHTTHETSLHRPHGPRCPVRAGRRIDRLRRERDLFNR